MGRAKRRTELTKALEGSLAISMEEYNTGRMCLYKLTADCKDFMYRPYTAHTSHSICADWDTD